LAAGWRFDCSSFNFLWIIGGGSSPGHGGNTFHKNPERLAMMSLPQLQAGEGRPQPFIYQAITKSVEYFCKMKTAEYGKTIATYKGL
jgi:hypothetical protein